MSDAPSCIKICQWDSDLALNYENVVEKVVYPLYHRALNQKGEICWKKVNNFVLGVLHFSQLFVSLLQNQHQS